MTTPYKLSYGIRNGVLVHVQDVQRGLACACLCAACGEPLIAKKGNVRQHYFSHTNGSDCIHSLETALHLAAKEILEARKEIYLPEVRVSFYSPSASYDLLPAKTYQLNEVFLERRTGRIVPDVLAHVNGELLMIEILVTHKVDTLKASEVRKMGFSMIEIDLSNAPRDLKKEDIESLVVGPGPHKKWIHNVESAKTKGEILSRATTYQAVSRGFARHIDGCPLSAREWMGRPYANVLHNCLGCERLLEIDKNMRVIKCGATKPT